MYQRFLLLLAGLFLAASCYVGWKSAQRYLYQPNPAAFRFFGQVGDQCAIFEETGLQITPYLWNGGLMLGDPPNRLGIVEIGKRSGLVDDCGKVIVPCQHEFVVPVSDDLQIIKIMDAKRSKLINRNGETIFESNEHQEIPLLSFFGRAKLQKVNRRGKFGCIDRTGKEVIPCEWDDGCNFFDLIFHDRHLATVQRDSKWGVIDQTGKLIANCEWDEISITHSGNLIVRRAHHWGVIDRQGKSVIPVKYDSISEDTTSNFFYAQQNIKHGLLARNGDWVIPPEWDKMYRFDPTSYCVKRNDVWGVIEQDGRMRIPLEYDAVSAIWNKHGKPSSGPQHAHAVKDGKHLIIDQHGKTVLRTHHPILYLLSNDIALIGTVEQCGAIDRQGQVLFEVKYDSLDLEDGVIEAYETDYRGQTWFSIATTSGKWLIPPEWNFIREVTYGSRTYRIASRATSTWLKNKTFYDLLVKLGWADWDFWKHRTQAVFDHKHRMVWNSDQEAFRPTLPWISLGLLIAAIGCFVLSRRSTNRTAATAQP